MKVSWLFLLPLGVGGVFLTIWVVTVLVGDNSSPKIESDHKTQDSQIANGGDDLATNPQTPTTSSIDPNPQAPATANSGPVETEITPGLDPEMSVLATAKSWLEPAGLDCSILTYAEVARRVEEFVGSFITPTEQKTYREIIASDIADKQLLNCEERQAPNLVIDGAVSVYSADDFDIVKEIVARNFCQILVEKTIAVDTRPGDAFRAGDHVYASDVESQIDLPSLLDTQGLEYQPTSGWADPQNC